jgi:hypothetical protein
MSHTEPPPLLLARNELIDIHSVDQGRATLYVAIMADLLDDPTADMLEAGSDALRSVIPGSDAEYRRLVVGEIWREMMAKA